MNSPARSILSLRAADAVPGAIAGLFTTMRSSSMVEHGNGITLRGSTNRLPGTGFDSPLRAL